MTFESKALGSGIAAWRGVLAKESLHLTLFAAGIRDCAIVLDGTCPLDLRALGIRLAASCEGLPLKSQLVAFAVIRRLDASDISGFFVHFSIAPDPLFNKGASKARI